MCSARACANGRFYFDGDDMNTLDDMSKLEVFWLRHRAGLGSVAERVGLPKTIREVVDVLNQMLTRAHRLACQPLTHVRGSV